MKAKHAKRNRLTTYSKKIIFWEKNLVEKKTNKKNALLESFYYYHYKPFLPKHTQQNDVKDVTKLKQNRKRCLNKINAKYNEFFSLASTAAELICVSTVL